MINKALKARLRFSTSLEKETIWLLLLCTERDEEEEEALWGGLPWPWGSIPIPTLIPTSLELLTTHRSHRLVSLAVRTVTLPGATSGGACRVWITREGWLRGLGPTTFTCRIRNLQQEGRKAEMSLSVLRECSPASPGREDGWKNTN